MCKTAWVVVPCGGIPLSGKERKMADFSKWTKDAQKVGEKVEAKATEVAKEVKEKATEVAKEAPKAVEKAKEAAKPVADKAKEAAKPVVKKAKAAAKPAAEKAKAASKTAATKAKAATKTATTKAKAASKTVATKAKAATATAAKKVESVKIKSTVSLQFSGRSYTTEELIEIAKNVWKYDLNQKPSDLKSIELYVKPEENNTYYVMNETFTGSFFI